MPKEKNISNYYIIFWGYFAGHSSKIDPYLNISLMIFSARLLVNSEEEMGFLFSFYVMIPKKNLIISLCVNRASGAASDQLDQLLITR